jgi:hypothetical protein
MYRKVLDIYDSHSYSGEQLVAVLGHLAELLRHLQRDTEADRLQERRLNLQPTLQK